MVANPEKLAGVRAVETPRREVRENERRSTDQEKSSMTGTMDPGPRNLLECS